VLIKNAESKQEREEGVGPEVKGLIALSAGLLRVPTHPLAVLQISSYAVMLGVYQGAAYVFLCVLQWLHHIPASPQMREGLVAMRMYQLLGLV
jgi:hypothetical protein